MKKGCQIGRSFVVCAQVKGILVAAMAREQPSFTSGDSSETVFVLHPLQSFFAGDAMGAEQIREAPIHGRAYGIRPSRL